MSSSNVVVIGYSNPLLSNIFHQQFDNAISRQFQHCMMHSPTRTGFINKLLDLEGYMQREGNINHE